jgi:hypothetical protein
VVAVLVAFVGMLSYAVERTVLDESGVKRIATEMIRDDAIRERAEKDGQGERPRRPTPGLA